MKRNAFTMLELIFVIVVMGILGKFGVEFLAQAYKSFIFASVNHKLQSDSATAVEFMATRLQHRIKDSVIVRTSPANSHVGLSIADPITTYTVLEWVSSDFDGFRGNTTPNWSGIIDLEHPNTSINTLESPGTNTASIDLLIKSLSDGNSGVNDAALYFPGGSNDMSGYGWDANITDQNAVLHPIKSVVGQVTQFAPATDSNNFQGVTLHEYYKLAWTANAVVINSYDNTTQKGNLVFYYDYQPWKGETLADGKHFILAENISTFQALAIGSVMKVQVCAKSDLIAEETYSLCKEKTIF